jgi:Leucine-rich repeat (LRR) protein
LSSFPPKMLSPLVDLLTTHDALARELAAFLSPKDQRPLLELCRAIVHSPLRRELFAKTRWSLPPARWMAERVLGGFTMKALVTRVLLQCEWQQYMLREFPALTDVQIVTRTSSAAREQRSEELAPQHFPVHQITKLDLFETKMGDMANLAAFQSIEELTLPVEIPVWNAHVLGSLPSLTNLCCNDIIDLTFVETLPNLRELFVTVAGDNIKPIAQLKRLETLNISRCTIHDLAPLMAVAPSLKSLDAEETRVSSWRTTRADKAAFISSLVNIRELQLSESQFLEVGLESFASLANLTALELAGVQFEDLSPLASLVHLERLAITAGPDADWSPLKKLTKLKNLSQFWITPTIDGDSEVARVLATLPSLETLSNPVALSPENPLLRLRWLTLSAPSRDQLVRENAGAPLDLCCPNIERLELHGCVDLSRLGLSRLKRLRRLNAMNLETAETRGRPRKHLIDYSAVAEVPSLTDLVMSYSCEAMGYEFLDSLANLRELRAFKESIKDASSISKMRHLEYLSLSNSPVEDVASLGNLRHLRTLDLGGTKVKDVSSLRGLPSLTVLDLPSCADCSPLVNEYGVALPSVTNLTHRKRQCAWEIHIDLADGQDPPSTQSSMFQKRIK